MKIPNYIYLVYDISLVGDNKYCIDLYGVTLETNIIKTVNNSQYVFHHIESFLTESLESEIMQLRNKGYISYHSFGYDNTFIDTGNPLLNIKTLLLSKNHKILSGRFNQIFENNQSYIESNIVYVNVNNGKLYKLNFKQKDIKPMKLEKKK